jgi:hemerythrin
MADLQWKPRFELGIPLIDEQHKRLFQLLSQLKRAVMERKLREEVEMVLTGLTRETLEHFHTEETFMAQMGFPGLEAHQIQHAKLLEDLKKLGERFRAGDTSMAMLVTTFMGSWLRHHIHEGDRVYADFLAKRVGQQSQTGSELQVR